MKNLFDFDKRFNRLDIWLPLITIGLFFPIIFAYLAYSEPQSTITPQESKSNLPSLSQIPSPTIKPSSSLLQRPQPIQPSPKGNPKSGKMPNLQTTPKSGKMPNQNSGKMPNQNSGKMPNQNSGKMPNPQQIPLVIPPDYSAPKLEIKVAIAKDVNSLVVGSSVPASIVDSSGQVLKTLSPNQGLWVTPNGAALTIGDWQLPQMVFVQPSQNGLIYVDDRWYRGKILLVSQGNSLLVVNYVDLEEYLYSVVGSEMHPTANIEALKAQAIAARSYALVHIIRPASQWYNLGNTQRWQVYKGIQTEYTSTHLAVSETAGQILSYKGGVVESLYAATDEIVARAHKGKGMSQTGAYKLAEQGYDHQQILGYYYPGVGLARLVLQ